MFKERTSKQKLKFKVILKKKCNIQMLLFITKKELILKRTEKIIIKTENIDVVKCLKLHINQSPIFFEKH